MEGDISDITKRFREYAELKGYADAQYKALNAALDRIKALQDEVEHLKSLLSGTTPLIEKAPPQQEVVAIEVPTEQAICEMELNRLQATAIERPLTFEETKRMDLLVKNLFLSRGQSTTIIGDYKRLPAGVSEARLLEIASADEQ